MEDNMINLIEEKTANDRAGKKKPAGQDFSGHRARMFETLMNSRPNEISPERLLEMVLYSSIPRRDTYSLSKELIATFGSVRAVFLASPSELLAVKGVGMRTVHNLKLVLEMSELLAHPSKNRLRSCTTEERIREYLSLEFQGRLRETSLVILLNEKRQVIKSVKIAGTNADCRINLNDIALELDAAMPRYLIAAHNHTMSGSLPSYYDRVLDGELAQMAQERGAELIGSYLVYDGKCTKIINE